MRKEKNKEATSYSGNLPGNYLEKRTKMQANKSKELQKYSGDLPSNFLKKRDQARQDKNRQVSSYSGDILAKTLQAKAKKIRKKGKEMANFRGDIIVHRVKKGMHPSAAYRGGKIRNSYKAKERYRKRVMNRYRKNNNVEVPESVKKRRKEKKPTYDKNEAAIWY